MAKKKQTDNEIIEELVAAATTEETPVVEAQNYYCEQQLRNERTYNVLKAKLGEERAKYFILESVTVLNVSLSCRDIAF